VTSISTDGSNVATVVFSAAVVSIGDISQIVSNGNAGIGVVGGLGTQLVDVDFGAAVDPGQAWSYTEPAAAVVYVGGEIGVSSSGVNG
jgi:hypothetical protein